MIFCLSSLRTVFASVMSWNFATAAASFVANCRSLAEALNAPRRPPVVVAGKRGAGRTAAIRELASRCGAVVHMRGSPAASRLGPRPCTALAASYRRGLPRTAVGYITGMA